MPERRRAGGEEQLERLFRPRSIALLGASPDPAKFGGRPLAALRRLGFGGRLIWVGGPAPPDAGLIRVDAVEDLPADVDLAIVVAPAGPAVDLAAACVERGVGALVVMAAGFAEVGEAGARRQRRLRELARSRGVRLLGPNCPGFVNVHDRIAASASGFALTGAIFPGPLGLVSQSGAVAGILAGRALGAGVGLGAVVCTGNQADVEIGEAAGWLAADPRNRVIGLFVERLGTDPELLARLEAVRRAGVPIVALRAGASRLARDVTASHTGAVAGPDSSWAALRDDLGIVEAERYDEFVELAAVLSLRRPTGRRVALVGASGGVGALIADAAGSAGLELPDFSAETESRVKELVPDFGRIANPLDLASSILTAPERLASLAEVVAEDPGADVVVVAVSDHPAPLSARIADLLADVAGRCSVPLVAQWSGGEQSRRARAEATRRGVPVLGDPARLAWVLARVDAALAAPRRRPPPPAGLPPAPRPGATEHELKAMLAELGLEVPRRRLPADPSEAAAAVAAVGGVAVLKANVAGAVHKRELGAIRLGVIPAEAAIAAAAVEAAALAGLGAERVRGVLVEQRVEPLAEILVSVRADPLVGAVLLVAAGGSLAGPGADAAMRIAPVDEGTAAGMLADLRLAPLLQGGRGGVAIDLDALSSTIATVSRLGAAWAPRFGLLELNPVAALASGAVVLDAVYEATGDDGGTAAR